MSNKSIAVIGEGITEKYYIDSLQGLTAFTVMPRALGKKASNLKELEDAIKQSIKKNFDYVCCLVDMDTKKNKSSLNNYIELKNKYHNINHKNPIKTNTKVLFFESERCIELWFLYHFWYTTTEYKNQEELIKELQKYVSKYDKTEKYFRSLKNGIHGELMKNKGDLSKATKNGKASIKSKTQDNRDYTYTELHDFIKLLGIDA